MALSVLCAGAQQAVGGGIIGTVTDTLRKFDGAF